MAQDLYLFHVCQYSRSEYEYKYWAVKYEYKYIASKYKYKYLKCVLEYYSSTSTSTKYYNSGGDAIDRHVIHSHSLIHSSFQGG